MNTKTIKLIDKEQIVMIPAGIKGEHGVTEIVFDYSILYEKYGEGTCQLLYMPPLTSTYYPVVTEDEDKTIKWIVEEKDTSVAGIGLIEVRYYTKNGALKKTSTMMISIKDSKFTQEEPPPDPVRDWVDQAAEFLGALKVLNIVQDVFFEEDMLNISLYDGSVKKINFKDIIESYNYATKDEVPKYLSDILVKDEETGNDINALDAVSDAFGIIAQELDDKADKSYVDEKVADLVNQAPDTLDTLKELSDALGNDPNFATTILAKIGEKANSDIVYTKEETDDKISRKVGASNTAFENYYDGVLFNALERFGNQAAEQLATKQSRDIYLEYGKPITEQGFESVEDILVLAMTGVTVNVVDFRSNEFAIMSRADIGSFKLVFCNDKHLYTISIADGSWGKEEAGEKACRVQSLSGAELTDGTAFETIGCPEYISADNLAEYSDYGLTEAGWYVFARIHGREGDYIGDNVSLITGVAGIKPPNYGDKYVDVAIKFDVASESQKVTIQWNDRVETFVFKATDLAIRNLDYRVTFYLYNIDDYCTWEYQLATDATFVAGKGYYKLQNGQYVKQTVTTGASVPANTYYVHKSLTIRGFTRNMSYTLDTTVDCPVTIHLPEVGGDNYGAWFEVQMNFLAAYSVTVVPSPGQKVSANGVNTPKVGINIVNILYHKPTNTWLPTLTNWKVSES